MCVQVFDEISKRVKTGEGGVVSSGYSVTVEDCGAMPMSFRGPPSSVAPLESGLEASAPSVSEAEKASAPAPSLSFGVSAPSASEAEKASGDVSSLSFGAGQLSFGTSSSGNPSTGFNFDLSQFGVSGSGGASKDDAAGTTESSLAAPSPVPAGAGSGSPFTVSGAGAVAGAGSGSGSGSVGSSSSSRFVFLTVHMSTPTSSGGRGKRVVIELYTDALPLTTANFRALCTGEKGPGLTYKGSKFHRVLSGTCVQGGDFTRGDGRGGMSIYGKSFADESFKYGHERGCLSMANSGVDSNTSQFFVCLKRTKGWDGKHVVFGRVVSGLRVRVLRDVM